MIKIMTFDRWNTQKIKCRESTPSNEGHSVNAYRLTEVSGGTFLSCRENTLAQLVGGSAPYRGTARAPVVNYTAEFQLRVCVKLAK